MLSTSESNEFWLNIASAVVASDAGLDAARVSFEATQGDFNARFTAAVHAVAATMMRPELFIDIPERPEELTKAELDALVRPAASGFLRSYPRKGELLDQVAAIKRRQERRPAWVPRVDGHGNPVQPVDTSDDDDSVGCRSLVVTAFGELGEVTIELPAVSWEPVHLEVPAGGIGELEVALMTLLGIVGETTAADVVLLDGGRMKPSSPRTNGGGRQIRCQCRRRPPTPA